MRQRSQQQKFQFHVCSTEHCSLTHHWDCIWHLSEFLCSLIVVCSCKQWKHLLGWLSSRNYSPTSSSAQRGSVTPEIHPEMSQLLPCRNKQWIYWFTSDFLLSLPTFTLYTGFLTWNKGLAYTLGRCLHSRVDVLLRRMDFFKVRAVVEKFFNRISVHFYTLFIISRNQI